MNISTRLALQEDLPVIARLFDLYRQFYDQQPNLALAREFLTERFNRGESVILVAEEQEHGAVGFCQMYPTFCSVEAAPIYSLYDLFVLPVARNMGAGRQLLQAAEERARADGMARMDLTTAKTNLAAQSLYESMGWVRDEIFYAYNRRPSSQTPV